MERTIEFYQGVLGFPLTEVFENRDYPGRRTSSSTSAPATRWPSSTSPASTSAPYAEVLGGHHHLAISVEPEQWAMLRDRLDAAGIEHHDVDGVSMYLRGPDGERIELLSDPLGEMYGDPIL